MRPSEAMLDRLERVIETLQDNSVKMGQMLAVHDEKLDKQSESVLISSISVWGYSEILFKNIKKLFKQGHKSSSKL